MQKPTTKPHFGGMWMPAPDAKGRRPLTVIMFLGDAHFVRADLAIDAVTRKRTLDQELLSYIVEADMLYLSAGGSDGVPTNMIEHRWRLTRDHHLEIETGEAWRRWEPVSLAELLEIGFPAKFFDAWRETYVAQGLFYSDRPLVPVFE